MSLLTRALSGRRRDIALGTLLASTWQAGEAAVPFLIGVIIDRAVSGGLGDLALWLGALGVVYVCLSYSFRYADRIGERISEQTAHELRMRIVQRVLHERGGAETDRLPGALVSVATSDARRVGTVAMAVVFGISAVGAVLIAAVLLLSVSLPLGLLVLLGTPPLILLTRLIGKPLEARSETEQEHAAHASGVAADLVAGLRVVKGLRAESAAVTRYRDRSRAALAATVHASRTEAAYQGMVVLLSGVFLAIIAVVGGILAVRGELTVGQLISSVGLAQFLVGPMWTFGWAGTSIAQGRASARRIAAVLDAPPAVRGGSADPVVPVRGALAVRRSGLKFEVAPGEFVGIVASDPALAASLVRLFGRACDPEDGTITLDGRPLTDLSPTSLRSVVLATDHHTDLFDGTLREAISLSGRAPAEAVEAAMVAADADEVERTLPSANLEVRTLSGGQKQRVALARALAADPPVLVVHDPTTAMDAVTEARIAGRLRGIRAGRTTVLVTTSPALLAVTDRVIVLAASGACHSGTHRELLASEPTYRETVLA
ncbi:ABC transporter transmembrane domain-containing protein [Actinoplanes regularis]|uniref:Putative ABC transport system ATP-binding protein n=1 Tax=Actinoplanes regularis TaxID=52697 RepID=A0A239D2Q1_9ACTN|nr:ABC transporter ATP-binding protein [Actinoplanes regularis]GIE88444.1 multidrug ABC transporter ATP-binding protein [Actinoplanes regularis]SNS26422.1 putative ABC transport system ATP-binding protein [Actinoplanes regularis]